PREAAAAFAHAIRAARLAVKSWREWQDANYRLGPRPSPDLPHVFIDPYRTRELIAHLWGGFLYWKALARVRPAAPSVRLDIERQSASARSHLASVRSVMIRARAVSEINSARVTPAIAALSSA